MNRSSRISLMIVFLVSCSALCAQDKIGFEDSRDYFHVFDGGTRMQVEHLKVQSFKVGYQYIAYVDNLSNFKIYDNGETKIISDRAPRAYWVTENQVVYNITGYLKVYTGGEEKIIAAFIRSPISVGDSLIAFIDQYGFLQVYDGQNMVELHDQPPKGFIINIATGMFMGSNILAYTDHNDQFMCYYKGEHFELERYAPKKYISGKNKGKSKVAAGRNTVAYVNDYDQFMLFHKGEFIELESFAPSSFKVGDDIVAYVDQNGYFKLYQNGIVTEIDDAAPRSYAVRDEMIVFINFQGYFNVYHKGKLTTLEAYVPKAFKFDEDMLAYLDVNRNLKAYYNGQVHNVSSELIKTFNVKGNVLHFTYGNNLSRFFYNNKIY